MDGDIFHSDGTPLVIEGMDASIKKPSIHDRIEYLSDEELKQPNRVIFEKPSGSTLVCEIYGDGSYYIYPDLPAEEYRLGLEMVIEYFTKGKK